MIDRIRQIMAAKELTASQFADSMEVPRAVLSHILSERNKPSLDVIIKIANTFPDISIPWLLMGKGSMLSSLADTVAQSPVQQTPDAPHVSDAASPTVAKHTSAGKREKMQNDENDASFLSAILAQKKSIEQVMVLYTDKTFAVYKPEK